MADVLRRKTDLVHQALDSAVSRLNESTDATPFAAIGELLFWVVASDEVLRASNLGDYVKWRQEEPARQQLLQGLRFVRNGFAHDLTGWHLDATETQDIYTERYQDKYGPLVWLPAPEPRDPKQRTKWVAYDKRLKGRAVLDTVWDARDEIEAFWSSLLA